MDTKNIPALSHEQLTEQFNQATRLVFTLFNKFNLMPKKVGRDHTELGWRIGWSPIAMPDENPFTYHTYFHPQYKMQDRIRVEGHLVTRINVPYILVCNNYLHNSINIQGTIRTQTRKYRCRNFYEEDWTFLPYNYADTYDELLELSRKAFKPELLRQFIEWRDTP